MNGMRRGLGLMFWLPILVISTAYAANRLSDDEVRAQIIATSVATYTGSCPCPYHADRAGRACGARSAWSKAGGKKPVCFATEITDDDVREWRKRNET